MAALFYFRWIAPAPRGLKKRILERLARESYTIGDGTESDECVICITIFEEGEEIKVLPCKTRVC